MSVKSSFYNEYAIKNNEKHVLWAQRSYQNHHQMLHDRCPEKIGPLLKKIGPLVHPDMSGKYRTGPDLVSVGSPMPNIHVSGRKSGQSFTAPGTQLTAAYPDTIVASNHLEGPHRESPKAMNKLSDTLIDSHLGQRRYQLRKKNDHI